MVVTTSILRIYMVNLPTIRICLAILISHDQCATSIAAIHVRVKTFHYTGFTPHCIY